MGGNKNEKMIPPMSWNTLLDKPFGYNPTIKNFKKNIIPPYKLSIYSMKNIHKSTQIDTIYRFYHKKSELFVYKIQTGGELFFAGNIYDNKIRLLNGVEVGMNRGAFFNSFTDLKYSPNDTVKLASKTAPYTYKFVFKKDILSGIKIETYID